MPRQKVPLADRKRALAACQWCKVNKKRCDGKSPCDNCARRGNDQSCTYFNGTPETRAAAGSNRSNSNNQQPVKKKLIHDQHPRNGKVETHVVNPKSAPHKTKPRMLSNSQGEKVYIGRSASIAFLQLVRETVTQQIGATDFSQHAGRDYMLESINTSINDVDLQIPIAIEPEQRQEYINLYEVSTSGLLNLFTTKEIHNLTNIENETEGMYQFAIGRLVLAIGAQCSTRLSMHRKHELQLFDKGRVLAMSGMLENPSLEFVTAFLLMAFYMLGDCQRNAAFMYVGVAVRAAYMLGLHSLETYSYLTEPVKQQRTRVWQSLVTIDEMISSILDRPSAIYIQHIRTGPMTKDNDSKNNTYSLAFGESFRLSTIIAEVGEKLQEKSTSSLASAKSQLQEIRKWSQSLPESLKNLTEGRNRSIEIQKAVVGSLHVSCYHYFAIILITRPFLVAYLSERHKTNGYLNSPSHPRRNPNDEFRVSDMAYACLRAAVGMSQTCSDVSKSSGLFENMRFLKAWLFSAGLVIGFHMFAEPNMDAELEEEYRNIHNILSTLSRHSLQAAHYFDILSCLHGAIQQRRCSLGFSGVRTSELVPERILNFVPNKLVGDTTTSNADGLPPTYSAEDAERKESMGFSDDEVRKLQLEMDDSMWIWENAASQIWSQVPDDMFLNA